MSSCRKLEFLLASDSSDIKSPTDIVIAADVLERCSRLVSTHDQVGLCSVGHFRRAGVVWKLQTFQAI